MVTEKIAQKARIRKWYKNAAGDRLPGVTTVCNELAMPALTYAAWKLGTEGIDYQKHWNDLASVGTLAHEYVIAQIMEIRDRTIYQVETSEYTGFQIERAEWSFESGLAWIRERMLKPAFLEHEVISELHQFGGRLDYLGDIDAIFTLADFKTGKAAYDNYFYQLAGYEIGLEEDPEFLDLNKKIQQYMIVNIPRLKDDKFQVRVKSDISREREIFLSALNIRKLKKELERKKKSW